MNMRHLLGQGNFPLSLISAASNEGSPIPGKVVFPSLFKRGQDTGIMQALTFPFWRIPEN